MNNIDKLKEINENLIVFKDYDYESAIIGISEDDRVIYSYDLMVKYLQDNEDMSDIDAIEWLEYNTIRANHYNSDSKKPIILYTI